MRVLAIDSSGLTATVAIVDETETIAEYTINYKKTHEYMCFLHIAIYAIKSQYYFFYIFLNCL